MAQPKTFRFYLRYNDSGTYKYYYVSGGSVLTTTTQTQLSRAPLGWKDCEVGWERGFTYFGLFTNYTTPLKFIKDGAMILRSRSYVVGGGIESKLELFVEKFNPSTYAYETFFTGDLDMSQSVDEFNYVTANIMESGFPTKFKANESTPYEYDIDGNPDVQYVYHDGIELQAKLFWTGAAMDMHTGSNGNDYPDLAHYDTQGTNIDVTYYNQDGSTYLILQNNSIVAKDFDLECTFNLNVFVVSGIPVNSYMQLEYREVNLATGLFTGVDYFIENSTYVHVPSTSHTYLGSNSQTITIPSGLGISVTLRMKDVGSSAYLNNSIGYIATTIGMDISAGFTNRYDPTYVQGLYVFDVLGYLIQSIGAANDGTAMPYLSVDSSLLTTDYEDQLIITSGDGLRGLEGSKLKITFADLYKFLDSKFGVCFYYDSSSTTCYLEKKGSVFINSVSTTYPLISSCAKMRVTPFIQEAFNNLKIGSGTFTYDQKGNDVKEITNGKDEFNNTTEWNTPLVRVKKTADYVSPIRCDMYGIEFTRINESGKTISDAESDNEVFAMHVNADNSATYYDAVANVTINYHTLYRQTILVGTWEILNIYSPESAYNILFSPKRSMIRNGPYFRSLLKFNDNDYINFQVSGKNNAFSLKMITYSGGVADYNEGENILVSALCESGTLLFQPVILEFETKEQINLYNLIESDKYRYIEVIHLGNSYYGFLISVKSKPAKRGVTQFKLLATAGTDLSQLIR